MSGADGEKSTTVYTDGACLGNPGPGGWGWAIPGGHYASGSEAHTTNQRMELTAAWEAMRALSGPLVVVSDSKYLVDCFNVPWYPGWEAKDWRTSGRKPVANQDLWKPMVQQFHDRHDELTFRWVKGHSADVMNDLVDRLATEAARTQTGRSGTQPPAILGAADRPGSRGTPGPPEGHRAPDGHRVIVLGHRPPQLGGYGENPVSVAVRTKLASILAGLKVTHPDLVVLTGLGLGAEQLAAQAAAQVGVRYVAVLAYPDPDKLWPAAGRDTYRHLADGATEVITIAANAPASKGEAGIALGRRNEWLASRADAAIVVWDGKERSLARDVAQLERRLPDDVWVVAP